MKKIKIVLTPNELASVIHIVGEKEKEIHHSSLNENLSLNLVDKFTNNLDDSQKEEVIKIQIKAAIFRLTGIPSKQIKGDDGLTEELQMTSPQIRSLAIPLTNIAKHYKASARIVPDDCEEQDTVQDCVDLVMDKTK